MALTKNKVEPIAPDKPPHSIKMQTSDDPSESEPAIRKVVDELNGRTRAMKAANCNSLVWKDTHGNFFTTFDSNSLNETYRLSDILDAFNFDKPELIIRLLGVADQSNDSMYVHREMPDLEYCVSYTGKGGIIILPQPLRRRFIQFIHDVGAWVVSDYEGTDIIESTNQPYVLPKQLKPKFYSDISLWPPTFPYSSVRLAYTSIPKSIGILNTPDTDDTYFESVILTNGDQGTLRKLLELVRHDKAKEKACQLKRLNVILLKGSGGLADTLASGLLEQWSYQDFQHELAKLDLDVPNENCSVGSALHNVNSHKQVKQPKSGCVSANVMTFSEEDLKDLFAVSTVFEADLTLSDYGLNKQILLSILKVYPEKKWRLLKLCVELDCFDVAQKYVLPDRMLRDLSLPVVQSAFLLNRIKFIEYFIRIGTFGKMQEDENVMSSIVTDSRAMSFSDDTLWKAKHWYKNDFFGVYDHLFRQCLVSNKIELSQIFWLRTKNPLGNLLLAADFLKKKTKLETNDIKKNKLREAVQQYRDLAAKFVDACYDSDREITLKMITRKLKEFSDQSCIDMALSSENMDFLVQPACVTLQTRVWLYGNLWDFYTENFDPTKLLFRRKTAESIAVESNSSEHNTKKHKEIPIKTAIRNYFLILCAPVTMFSLNGIGLLIFLFVFGLTFLGRFEQHKYHIWLDLYLLLFVIVIILEEIYEFVIAVKQKNWRTYVLDGWNIVDLTSVILFLVGTGLRVAAFYSPDIVLYNLASIFFSLDFIVFSLRLLHNCYSNQVLGPTFTMIVKTIEILIKFLYILAIFWASYAVATEAILYPNSVLKSKTLFYLFHKAYFQMFGEYFLDDIMAEKSDDADSHCTDDPTLYASYKKLRCPTFVGRYYVPILLGVYVMFTNVLLMNLITASFTKSIEKIQQKATKLWRFQLFQLTRDYSRVFFLPLPFTFISILARIANYDPRGVDGFSVTDTKNAHLKKMSSFVDDHKKNVGKCLNSSELKTLKHFPKLLKSIDFYFDYLKLLANKKHKTPRVVYEIEDILMTVKDVINEFKKYTIRTELINTISQKERNLRNSQVKHLSSSTESTLNTSDLQLCIEDLMQSNTNISEKILKNETLLEKRNWKTKRKLTKRAQYEVQRKLRHTRYKETPRFSPTSLKPLKELLDNLELSRHTFVSEIYEVKKSFADLETFIEEDNLVSQLEQCIEKSFEGISEVTEWIEKLETLVHEGSWYDPSSEDYELQEKNEKQNTLPETLLLDKKLKALRGIKRRLKVFLDSFHFNNGRDQIGAGEKGTMNEEWNSQIRGLQIAFKDYQHVYLDDEITQMLNELECLMLQENNPKSSPTNMSAVIRDLELFVMQSYIEPSLQAEWKEKQTFDWDDPERSESDKVAEATQGKGILDSKDGIKKDFRNMSKNETNGNKEKLEIMETEFLEEEIKFYWIPTYKISGVPSTERTFNLAYDKKEPKHIKFNQKDKKHNIDRRSYLGRYELDQYNQPINPLFDPENKAGKTVELLYWGPNHFGVPIISRLKRVENKIIRKENKFVLEFLVIRTAEKDHSTKKYKLPEVPCAPDKDPFMEFINSLEREARPSISLSNDVELTWKHQANDINGSNNQSNDIQPSWRKKFNNALKKIRKIVGLNKKMKLKPLNVCEMKPYQKIKTMYIGPVKDERYMTEHKWMEIRALNFHNPNTHYQNIIDNHLTRGFKLRHLKSEHWCKEERFEWIDYQKYKLVDNIVSDDVFTNVCSQWGAYVERRPGTAKRSPRPV
ncbi:uncharacterized protein LOC106066222 isoform X3 [Biomphalaria glabrata]|uniref:Uncharacterized protein LOC106066222 isoform X3 n=1 Tax=Biomphalaria glabrata TaxID=6526 RepID=A0A9W2YAI1_BIOGL|nr:uncharacterized protein LOC106066222 isoform X3 [Biomphalaria glabrata]